MIPISIVIPCYDEQDAIRDTVESISRIMPESQDYEMLVVDDGSEDGSGEILDELKRSGEFPHLRVIHHPRNQGYGASLKRGILQASYDWIVITDADGTYPNERIPDLVRHTEETGVDMTVGARTGAKVTYSKIRKIPKVFLRAWVSWLAGSRVPDMNSGLRVMRKSLVLKYLHYLPDGFSFTTTITLALMRNKYSVDFVPIDYAQRKGRSKIQPVRDTIRFTNLVLRTGLYFAPLKVFLPIAGVLFVCAAVSAFFDVFWYRNLADKTVMFSLFAVNTAMFALLADMIDKRSYS